MTSPLLAALDQPGKVWLIVAAAPAECSAIAHSIFMTAGDAGAPSAEGLKIANGAGDTGGAGAGGAGDDAGGADGWQELALSPRFSLVRSGVGKANAAAAIARVYDSRRHTGVLNLGIAGALPGSGLELLDVILAQESVYADEGTESPAGFIDIASIGFAPGIVDGHPSMAAPGDPALLEALAPLATLTSPIATVSTCSGTDARALAIAQTSGAAAEAMEGAAAGFTLLHLTGGAAPFAELRVISNTTGDRPNQRWKLREALAKLADLAALL